MLSASTSQVYKHNRTSTVPVEFHRSLAHVQTVETRPFSPHRLGAGNEANHDLVSRGPDPSCDDYWGGAKGEGRKKGLVTLNRMLLALPECL